MPANDDNPIHSQRKEGCAACSTETSATPSGNAAGDDQLDPLLREEVYHALRNYQDGKLEVKCVVVGRLTPELTALYDRLIKRIKRPIGGDQR